MLNICQRYYRQDEELKKEIAAAVEMFVKETISKTAEHLISSEPCVKFIRLHTEKRFVRTLYT
jgi:hypothetical protein